MSKQPKISVIIPVYNTEKYLRDCLDSVVNQTLKDIEIICVDDGSTDSSRRILEEYRQKDDRVRILFHDMNRGLLQARKTGVRNARGSWALFLDSDDTLTENAVERVLALAEQADADILQFTAEPVFSENEEDPWLCGALRPHDKMLEGSDSILRSFFVERKNNTSLVGKAFRMNICKAAYDRLPDDRFTMGEDIITFFFLALSAGTYSGTEETLYYYYVGRGVSRQKTIREDQFLEYCRMGMLFELAKKFLEGQKASPTQYEALYAMCRRMLTDCCRAFKTKLADSDKETARDRIAEYWRNSAIVNAVIREQFGCSYDVFFGRNTHPKKNYDAPCVSVIIPVYNAEKYLRDCLNSVVRQTLKNIEIICVDDGSKDGSLRILNEYAAKDGRIRVLHQNNLYAGIARNNGINQARGEYLVFLDADDFFDLTLLQKQYDQIRLADADICICGADNFDERTKQFSETPWLLNKAVAKKAPFCALDIAEDVFDLSSCAPWNKIYRTRFVREQSLEFQGLQRANDMFFYMVAVCLAERITTLDEVLVHYRTGLTDNLQSNHEKSPTDFAKALIKTGERLVAEGIYPFFERSFFKSFVDQSFYNLRRVGKPSSPAYSAIAKTIKEDLLPAFRPAEQPAEFFQDSRKYAALLDELEKSGEDFSQFRLPCLVESKARILHRGKYEKGNCPKVSVIIPVYRTEEYLPDCLESVLGQTLREIELICINDGSPDNSLCVLERYAQQDSRIIIVSQENRGLSCARNAGLETALGEYVCFLDSDDLLHPEAIQELYSFAKDHDLDQLFFDAETYFESEELKERFRGYDDYYHSGLTADWTGSGREFFAANVWSGAYRSSACLQLLRREYLNKAGLRFEPRILHEDNLFTFLCTLQAEKTGKLGKAYYIRRLREDSIMTRLPTIQNVCGYLRCGMKMMEYLMRSNYEQPAKKTGYSLAKTMLSQAGTLYRQLSPEEKEKGAAFTEEERMWLDLFSC